MKKILSILILSILLIPAFSFAQTAPAQINCLFFSSDLTIGSTGQDVSKLQIYLISKGFLVMPVGVSTGYFGNLTRAALASFQASVNITPSVGYFGSKTRGYINSHCGTTSNVSISSINPVSGAVGTYATVFGSGFTSDSRLQFGTGSISRTPYSCSQPSDHNLIVGCSFPDPSGAFYFRVPQDLTSYCPPGSTCAEYDFQVTPGTYPVSVVNANGTSNSMNFTVTQSGAGCPASYNQGNAIACPPPVINGINAPTHLSVNQTGTWTVSATDPQNEQLSYSVDWGDSVRCPADYTCMPTAGASSASSFQQSTSFSHSYSSSGVYTQTFTVRNADGQTAQTSSTVQVTNSNTQPLISVVSPNGGEQWAFNSVHTIKWNLGASLNQATPVDLYLLPICPDSPISGACATYTLDKNIASNSTYNWIVGTDINNNNIPRGSYYMKICIAGSLSNCGSSLSNFVIN